MHRKKNIHRAKIRSYIKLALGIGIISLLCSALICIGFILKNGWSSQPLATRPQTELRKVSAGIPMGTNVLLNSGFETVTYGNELLTNPGFEQLLKGWTGNEVDVISHSCPPNPTWACVEGTHFLGMARRPNAVDPYLASDWIETNQDLTNRLFTLTFSAKSHKSEQQIRGLSVQRFPLNDKWDSSSAWFPIIKVADNSKYVTYSLSGAFPANSIGNTSSKFRLTLRAGSKLDPISPVYYDALSLKETNIPNWKFEPVSSIVDVTYGIDKDLTGNMLRIDLPKQLNGGDPSFQVSQNISQFSGNRVLMRGWIKTSSNAKARIGYRNEQSRWVELGTPIQSAQGQFVSQEVYLPPNVGISFILQASGIGSVWFDNLSVSTPTTSSTLPKYASYTERFGVGMDVHKDAQGTTGRTIDEFPWKQLGVGWYLDWRDDGKKRDGLTYMGYVGAYKKGGPGENGFEACDSLKARYIDKSSYPDGSSFIVGDKVGADDGRNPDDYVADFSKWYLCLKSINPTFQIGAGAVSQLRARIPSMGVSGCSADLNEPKNGNMFLRAILTRFKAQTTPTMPDFYTSHGYTSCRHPLTDPARVDDFKTEIRDFRRTLAEKGEMDKDLIVTEWGPSEVDLTFEDRQRYLKETVSFLATEKDPQIGNAIDEGRLVQKWAWFILNDWKGGNRKWDKRVALTNTVNGEITPLGDLYRQLLIGYANPQRLVDDRFGISGDDGQITSTMGIRTVRSWRASTAQGALDRGNDTFFVIGKIDDSLYTRPNPDTWDKQPRCKRSATDPTIVKCVDSPRDGIPNSDDFVTIGTILAKQTYKNKAWEIANEPDAVPEFDPKGYAVWYYLYSKEILSRDPTAKLMIGGLLRSARADTMDPQKFAWLTNFRNEYMSLYGVYPQVDIWSTHPYAPWTKDGSVTPVNTVIKYITNFRTYLESAPGNERNKPIYLTEYGSLAREGGGNIPTIPCGYHGCLTREQKEKEWKIMGQFATGIVDWLTNSDSLGYAQKWYWYQFGSSYWWDSSRLDYAGAVDTFAEYNPDIQRPDLKTIIEPCKSKNTTPCEAPSIYPSNLTVLNPLGFTLIRLAKSGILYNPSFEAFSTINTAHGWDISQGSAVVDEGEKAQGDRSIKVRATSSDSPAYISQRMKTSAYTGKTIRFKGQTKTEGGSGAKLRIKGYKLGGAAIELSATNTVSTPSNWSSLETPSTVISSDVIELSFEGVASGAGNVWFDSFEIISQ